MCSHCQSSVLVLSLGRLCWEGLCLVHSSECCIKVCEPSPFVSLCSPNLFHHLLELWLLPAVPLSFLGTAAIHWGWVKLASISKLHLGFWRISISLLQWCTFPHPFPGRNSVSFPLLPRWHAATQVTASPSHPKLIISTRLHYTMFLLHLLSCLKGLKCRHTKQSKPICSAPVIFLVARDYFSNLQLHLLAN